MDFFEDLTKKTAKLIADVAESVKGFADQAGNAANKNVDIIKIKGMLSLELQQLVILLRHRFFVLLALLKLLPPMQK